MVDDKAVSSSQLIQSYKKVKTDEEYAHEVFHCVEKGCSLNETKDELLGEIERIHPMIGDRVAMHYNKALIDKLNQLSISEMSSRCLEKNPSFFELVAEKKLEEDNLFWLYLMIFGNRDINNTSNGHLEKQLQCLPDKEQKSLFSFWTTRLERLLPYFAPQTAEKELVRTIKVWLSSENFTEENDKKWTHLIQNSSNSINLEQLKKVVWTKESTREYLEFAHALENIQISTLTVDIATKLYTYLHDIFTLQVILSENAFGAVLTVSKKILFLSDSNEAMTKIRDKIDRAQWNIYEIRIYGCKLLVLNCDFEQKRFHGMNLILGASVLVVKTKLHIDLSGDSHNPKLRDPAPSALGNDGMHGSDGTDGKPGESSGNLFLFVNRIVNSDLLSILLNGGTGQGGQDGGNGAKGTSGKRVTKAELEGLMPKYTSLYLADDSYMINFVPDGFTICGNPESEDRLWNAWVYNSFTNQDGRRIEYSFSGTNSVTWNIYDIYFVVYGTVGSPGGAGGKNGLGGEGGKAGNLTAISMDTGKAIPIRHTKPVDGTVGCHGRCGGSGESGTDGNDMAMIDRSRGSNNNQFFPGEAGHSKLRAVFYSTDQTTSRTRLNGFYKFRRKEKKHYCGFEEVEIEPIPKTEDTQKRDESDRNLDSKAVSKEAISKEEIINEFKTNFVGVDIDFIVEDIIIKTGGNKVEDVVEENEVKEEISIVRTQMENVSHHETNLRIMQITTESVVKMIEDENWKRIVYPTVLEAEKWISVLSNVLQVPLNMNDHREAITTMLTRIKHLRDEKKGGNIFPGLLQLEADIEEKMRLSGHEYKRKHTQNDPRNPSKIQPIEQELFDVACGTQWVHDSAETRRNLVDKMESEAATFGAEHELLLALYDIYGYLDQHQELFKKYYAEINWSDYGQVKAHLKESLSETEQQAMEERTNKVINALDNDIPRLASKLWETYSGSAFRDIDKLLCDEHGIETTKVFSSLNKMIFDSSHMSERFTFEYDMYGNLKPVGTTATSLIHIYFFSKQILEFNMKMHRYREKASVKDWIVEDIRQRQSLRESLEIFRATINNYGYESPSKSFFDDLRKNGATSSAYRLLVAEEMNVNVQVYSQHGFAKVKLVENNNSNATEKHYLILNTSGKVFKAVSNEKVRKLRNLINSHEPELLLSEEVDLSQFVVPAFHAQITEWSDAVNASTNSTRFLKFLRRLFELRGCSETLTELQFAITTFIEAVCNFGISEDQMCRYLLGEHGCLRKWSLPLRLIVAVKNCSLTLEEISNMLEPIVDSRLRALFGAKLQGKKVESEDISKIVQLLTHSKDCFSELEHRSLSEWIDIAKCQQWGNYDHLMQSYGSIGYYFVLLESAQGQGPKEASEKLKTVLNRVPQPRILLEKVVSRLTSLILYKDIEFDNICQDSLCNLLRTISSVAGEFVESNAMILAITHGKTQNQVMDTVRKSHSKCLDSIFPSKERTFSDLLRITYPGSESEQFSSFVETVLNGGNRTEEVIKFLDQIDTALFEWTCSNEGKAKKLRETQKLAVLSAFFHDKNLLAQINTGEGKSFIIAALSILKILAGGPMTHVDIITSSSVLAIRDSEALKPFYAGFNITVGHNCHTNVEKRKGAYKCNIVYGDITQFERDYLLHAYYKKNILGSRKQEHVIVDESDSMCLDHGNNMLYLSHVVPGLDLLESLFVFIHKEVYSNRTTDKLASMTSALRKQILSDLFGTVTKDDIAKLVDEQDSSQINAIWGILSRYKVIGEDGILLDRPSEEMQAFATEMKSNFGETVTMSLLAIIHIVEHRKREIIVPEYLKPYTPAPGRIH